MGYIDKNLMTGEQVVYKARLHRIIFKWALLAGVAAIPCFFVGPKEFVYVGVGLLVLAVALAIPPALRSSSSEYGVTNKRLVVKTGLVSRDTVELLLTKVEAIQVQQSVMGRLFNYGTVVVTGTGGSKDHFSLISDPLTFRKKAQEQIAAIHGL